MRDCVGEMEAKRMWYSFIIRPALVLVLFAAVVGGMVLSAHAQQGMEMMPLEEQHACYTLSPSTDKGICVINISKDGKLISGCETHIQMGVPQRGAIGIYVCDR